jgi:hypothetical protein
MENDVPGTLHKSSNIQFQSIGFVGRQEEMLDNSRHLIGSVGELVVVGPGVPVFAAALLAIYAVVFGEIHC